MSNRELLPNEEISHVRETWSVTSLALHDNSVIFKTYNVVNSPDTFNSPRKFNNREKTSIWHNLLDSPSFFSSDIFSSPFNQPSTSNSPNDLIQPIILNSWNFNTSSATNNPKQSEPSALDNFALDRTSIMDITSLFSSTTTSNSPVN